MSGTANACRLCHSGRYVILGKEAQHGMPFTIVRCVDCSLVYVREKYAQVSPRYVRMEDQDLNTEHIWLQTKHKELAFWQCLNKARAFHAPHHQSRSRRTLLDVGCGVGGWLDFAKKEYECYGFDASLAQSSYASQRFPNVLCATSLREYRANFNGDLPGFDLITLWDVLEHIRDPVEFLSELANDLSPAGLLFAAVPAERPMVIKNRLLSFGWPKSRFSWSPHEHVAYYSPLTLRLVCEKCNLRVLKIGAVALYPRPLSLFEIIRRVGFWITNAMPQVAPQIYVFARSVSNP